MHEDEIKPPYFEFFISQQTSSPLAAWSQAQKKANDWMAEHPEMEVLNFQIDTKEITAQRLWISNVALLVRRAPWYEAPADTPSEPVALYSE